MKDTIFYNFFKFSTTKILKFVIPYFSQKNNNIKQTLMVYKVPPGDICANNYGRGHMKPSHQVSYDMRLPPNKKKSSKK